jgi:hypothetical protein
VTILGVGLAWHQWWKRRQGQVEADENLYDLEPQVETQAKPATTTGADLGPLVPQINNMLGLPAGYTDWMGDQKKRIQEICKRHGRTCRIIYRDGVEKQRRWGQGGPFNLIANDLTKEELTVWLMTEDCNIYRIIAFCHSDINKLPLRWYTFGNRPRFQTMTLEEFEKFRGKYCFTSFEDFENGFAFKECKQVGSGDMNGDAAFEQNKAEAEKGNAAAQYRLGLHYFTGQGVAKDEVEAAKWYRKAAEQNHAGAQYNLGVCYAKGQGVKQDSAEAMKWYRKAAEQGHAEAQSALRQQE